MSIQSSDIKKLGNKVKSKRTPWNPADLRAIKLYSSPAEALDLRKAGLMRHSRYSKNGTEAVEVRDKQSDPNDITIYGISENRSGSSSNFYDGSVGDDLLKGGPGGDYLQGRNGNDTLFGNSGNDFLDGGNGKDILTGGDGEDFFRIALQPYSVSGSEQSFDLITDFTSGQGDKIVINPFSGQREVPSSLQSVQLSNNLEETNRLTSQGAALIYEAFTGRLLAGADLVGAPGRGPVLLAILNEAPQATVDSFIFST